MKTLADFTPLMAKLLADGRSMHIRTDVTGCTILLMPGPDRRVGLQRTGPTFEDAIRQVSEGFDLLMDPAEGSR